MAKGYRPLTAPMLELVGELEGFAVPTWTGPALAAPASAEAVAEVLRVAQRLVAAGQALIQAKDATSALYTLKGVTRPAEEYLFGPEQSVEAAAGFRALVTTLQTFLRRCGLAHEAEAALTRLTEALYAVASWLPHWTVHAKALPPHPPAVDDPTAFALEQPRQYAMAWTKLQDIYRQNHRHLDALVENAFDRGKATEEFWPMLSRTALPYNLLVLRKLDHGNAERFRTNFGADWTPDCEANLESGTLYGIDMTIFAGLLPRVMADGTTRFTPNTMTLLAMGADKTLRPLAIYVADPARPSDAQTYLPSSPAWVYGLFAARTAITVYGIWLGHVFPLHLVTGAMLMTMGNCLPADHRLLRLLAPHSHSTMGFNLLLMLGWNQLAPPTSVADPSQFLMLAGRYGETHDFFSNDPATALADLGLDQADFTGSDEPWDLYPNVRLMLRLWALVADYVDGVIEDLYTSEAAVEEDHDLARWIAAAGATDDGNVVGLPRVRTKAVLKQVLSSLLYRIVFHGIGRLRSMSNPEPSFVPNFPPCLQSERIPAPDEDVSTSVLLREFLPRTGTVGGQLGFYNLFVFVSPTDPLVPAAGAGADLFFEPGHRRANASLVTFREGIERLVRDLQPDWVEIGQWPMCIEF